VTTSRSRCSTSVCTSSGRAVGRPELCDDPRFATATALVEGGHLEELGAILVAAFAELPVDVALQRLIDEDVPAGKILEPEEVLVDEQVVHNGILVEWEHPTAGRLRQPRHAVRFADAPTPIPQFVPHIGEHTDQVLAALGRTGDEVAALRAAGVVA
jgi:crotonobetainyl-CoA:carnitine CoA-transferase CaiB-like acyl-CoA transferase